MLQKAFHGILGSMLLAAGVASLLVACSAQPAVTPAPVTAAPVSWQERWQNTLNAARQEGKVVIYSGMSSVFQAEIGKSLKDKYGIEAEWVPGRGSEIAAKVIRERTAGIYSADAFIVGSGSLINTIKPEKFLERLDSLLIIPEVTDGKGWQQGKIPFMDPKDHNIIAFAGYVGTFTAANSDMVKEGEIKSYQDLLAPKWKGQIVLLDPTFMGAGSEWLSCTLRLMGTDKGMEFVKAMVNQEPVVTRDVALQADWIAKGKKAIALGANMEAVNTLKAAGAPVKWLRLAEGVEIAPGNSCLAVPQKAAHPNAAAVFVNYLLSKEGGAAVVKGANVPSARSDVPTAGLDPFLVPVAGEKAFVVDEDYFLEMPKQMEAAKPILAPLLK